MRVLETVVVIALCSSRAFAGMANALPVLNEGALDTLQRSVDTSDAPMYNEKRATPAKAPAPAPAPAAKDPVAKKPEEKEPAGKAPADKTPADKTPADKTPAGKDDGKDVDIKESKDAAELRTKITDKDVSEKDVPKKEPPKSCPMNPGKIEKKAVLEARAAYDDHRREAIRISGRIGQARQEKDTAVNTYNRNADSLDRMHRQLDDHRRARIHLTRDQRDQIARDIPRLEDQNRRLKRDIKSLKGRIKRYGESMCYELCWLSDYGAQQRMRLPNELAEMIANYAYYQRLAATDPDRK